MHGSASLVRDFSWVGGATIALGGEVGTHQHIGKLGVGIQSNELQLFEIFREQVNVSLDAAAITDYGSSALFSNAPNWRRDTGFRFKATAGMTLNVESITGERNSLRVGVTQDNNTINPELGNRRLEVNFSGHF